MSADKLHKAMPSVTAQGERLGQRISGFVLRRVHPVEDRRGDITEMYSSEWGLHEEPMVYAYQVSIRPGAIRGWEMHKLQDDRIFISSGAMRWVLFDYRPHSPTFERIDHFVVSELNRSVMVVPKGVIHAVQNVGKNDAIFVNFPTKPYDHSDPDKYRLPLKNDVVSFNFDDPAIW